MDYIEKIKKLIEENEVTEEDIMQATQRAAKEYKKNKFNKKNKASK